ncbi:hypothetical protein QZH41_010767 [Actinostola sp. cb2023]|nr:hypothetical protein QZH41_010767 [Actinostola sp. cb2023]
MSSIYLLHRKRNGYCRYFAKGDCRSGNDCKYSHDRDEIPICRYYMEDRCHFGLDCWYRHPEEEDMLDMSPIAAIIGSGLMCSINPNMNLLLAAAIAGAPTPGHGDKQQDSDDEKEKEDISLEKVLEMWQKFELKKDNKDNTENSSDEEAESFDFEEKNDRLQEFSDTLKVYSIKDWSPDDIFKLTTTLVDLDIKEYDEYDFITSKVLGDTLRLWKPGSQAVASLFMMMVEKCGVDLTALILTVCNSPNRVHSLEKHIAFTMLEAEKKDSTKWGTKAVGDLFQQIEENGFNIDAIEFFHSTGKETKDAEKLGQLVHDYLIATGEKDSFDCRCTTIECECPVAADEGVAFIIFAGLQRKLEWSDEDKVKFFKKATDSLWKPELLAELGDTFGVKEPLKIATPRKLNSHQTTQDNSKQETKLLTEETQKHQNKSARKCHGKACSNQNKKDCDNMMCGRCCRNSGKACYAHEDPLDVYIPPQYQSSLKFHNIEPSVYFTNKQKFEEFTSSNNKQISRVGFDGYFSVMDPDLIKVVDLWGDQLVVLSLGSSDSGCGSHLTDKSIQHLADNCPNLRKLKLESTTGVTDKAMCDIISKCCRLEELDVSGNDKISGKLTDKSLKMLFDDNALPSLKQLCVTDQSEILHDIVYRLRRRRPKLKIIAGETDSDSYAHSMVLSMMGLEYGDGLY